jgi:DNA polymerase-3 subunit epsilon
MFPSAVLDAPVVFVDLETTGADPARDRIVEIGMVKVAGGKIEYEWHALVDPQQPISPFIQGITGIGDDMVRGAPTFAAIAGEVVERLGDALFIAHNARFDVGFLKNEFRRLNRPFQPQVLCTVKLSRALYPAYHRHGLDAIIARHGLSCDARHRALGDARVLWDFVQLIRREQPADAVERALAKAMRTASLPPQLDTGCLESVPEGPGVYVFYGESDVVLYVGKSVNLRDRVRSHFTAGHSAGRAMRIAQEIRRIDWIETGGELGALLLEARLIKEKLPVHNRRLRGSDELCSWRVAEELNAVPVVELIRGSDIDPRQLGSLHGTFRTRREAVTALRELATAYQLCPRRLGLESGRGACFASQLKQCKGVCAGRESAAAHDLRLRAALSSLRLKSWPYRGRIAIREVNPEREREYVHLFDAWCHIATESSQGDMLNAAWSRFEPVFDVDTYKILARYFAAHPGDIVDLEAARVS